LLEEIPLWIKMFFVEKGIICMEPDRMVECTPSPEVGWWKEGGRRKDERKSGSSRRDPKENEMR
jgi:hypothetical protein